MKLYGTANKKVKSFGFRPIPIVGNLPIADEKSAQNYTAIVRYM